MTVIWLGAVFPNGLEALDRTFEMELAENHYPGAPGDEHEDLGDKALVIRARAELTTTYVNGKLDRSAEDWYSDLEAARDMRVPDILYLDNGASHRVWLRRLTRRDISPDKIEAELEFVETLDESLKLVKVAPAPYQAVELIEAELAAIEAAAIEANIPDIETFTAWTPPEGAIVTPAVSRIAELYANAVAFVQAARGKLAEIKNKIVAIRNLGADFGAEMERLAADINELVIETTSLYNDFCADTMGTFAIGRSLRSTLNALKGIEIQLASPPIARGVVNKKAWKGKVKMTKVVEGDTLHIISLREYGSPHMWKDVAAANGIIDPMELTTGQEIILPKIAPERVKSRCPGQPSLYQVEI